LPLLDDFCLLLSSPYRVRSFLSTFSSPENISSADYFIIATFITPLMRYADYALFSQIIDSCLFHFQLLTLPMTPADYA
jgi:hypothetical protein